MLRDSAFLLGEPSSGLRWTMAYLNQRALDNRERMGLAASGELGGGSCGVPFCKCSDSCVVVLNVYRDRRT